MNPDRISQLFLTFVNAGVLLSVILLVFELRQNREIAIAEIRNDISRQAVEREMFQASPEISEAIMKAESGQELSELETYRVERLLNVVLQNFGNFVYQYDAGMYTEEEFEVIEERIRTMPAFMLSYYKERTTNYSASFQKAVSDIHNF